MARQKTAPLVSTRYPEDLREKIAARLAEPCSTRPPMRPSLDQFQACCNTLLGTSVVTLNPRGDEASWFLHASRRPPPGRLVLANTLYFLFGQDGAVREMSIASLMSLDRGCLIISAYNPGHHAWVVPDVTVRLIYRDAEGDRLGANLRIERVTTRRYI